jgi:hypothetical protein
MPMVRCLTFPRTMTLSVISALQATTTLALSKRLQANDTLKPHFMTDHLLTFELSKGRDELFIHGNAGGLRYLARVALRLAEQAEGGKSEHDHMMTEEWAGHELSSVRQDPTASLINQVTIRGWPTRGGAHEKA